MIIIKDFDPGDLSTTNLPQSVLPAGDYLVRIAKIEVAEDRRVSAPPGNKNNISIVLEAIQPSKYRGLCFVETLWNAAANPKELTDDARKKRIATHRRILSIITAANPDFDAYATPNTLNMSELLLGKSIKVSLVKNGNYVNTSRFASENCQTINVRDDADYGVAEPYRKPVDTAYSRMVDSVNPYAAAKGVEMQTNVAYDDDIPF